MEKISEQWEILNDNTKVREIKPNLQNTSAFQEYWFAKRCYKAKLDFSRKEYELEEFKTFIERHRSLKSLFKVFRRNNTSCTLPNPQVFIEYCKKIFKSNELENTLELESYFPTSLS